MSNLTEIIIQILFFGIPQVIVLISCYKYYQQLKSLDSKLLFWGCLIGLVFYIFRIISIPTLMSFGSTNFYLFGMISLFSGIFILIGALSFSIGFYLLIKKLLMKKKLSDDSDINNLGEN